MTKRRTFIVYREEYTQHGPGSGFMTLVQAKDVVDLVIQLEPDCKIEYEGDSPNEPPFASPVAAFNEQNGDGADYYLIKELVDGELVDIPELGTEWSQDEG